MSRHCTTDKHLPPCVYHKHGAFRSVKRGKWEKLAATLPEALAEYAKSLTDAKQQGFNPQTLAGHTSEAMTDRYIHLRETPQADSPKMARILDNR
ncbi:MAG: hypothetical protein WAW10_02315 [Gallionella sp.]